MIVFISDLHFVDETAGKHNISAKAFKKFLESIKVHSDNTKNKDKEVKIVFLGDIFDLLRTEEWFKEIEDDRPWGNDTENMRNRAKNILEKIAEKNKNTFKLFSKEALKRKFKGINIETIYIPGNHDRLCWMIEELKEKVIELLGLNANNTENFKHYFSNIEHGVYATHGHIFDEFNYERKSSHIEEDYKLVPIGDPITTEIIAKLPYKLIKKVKEKCTLNEKEIEKLKRNFQDIENIRPLSATLKWLVYQVDANRNLKNIIEETINEVAKDFRKLKFVKNWYRQHDRKRFDIADKIQLILKFLRAFKVFKLKKFLRAADKIIKKIGKESSTKGAEKLLSELDKRIHYIVMGHTHTPQIEALTISNENVKPYEYVYLNTGTWRKSYYQYRDKSGFIGLKKMTYVIFYTSEEKPNKYNLPVFETWQGTEKRDE